MRSVLGRLQDDEGGFTLIELLVAIIIVAILAAILVPDLLGAKGSAQDSRAKAALDTAKTAAGEYFVTHNESFIGFSGTVLHEKVPTLDASVPTGPTTNTSTALIAEGGKENNPLSVAVAVPAAGEVVMCSAPNKGTAVWCIRSASKGSEWCYAEASEAADSMKEVANSEKENATSSYGGTSGSACGLKGYSKEGF